jgi:hypothetical protein
MSKRLIDIVISICLIAITYVITTHYTEVNYQRERAEYNSLNKPVTTLRRITEGGHYGTITITGKDPYNEDGLIIDALTDVVIDRVTVDNVRVPIIFKGKGKVQIKQVVAKHYTGDGLNIRQSNVTINQLVLIEPKPSLDTYHQDLILQAYAVQENGYSINTDGVIENIHIPSVTLIGGLKGKDLITLSEDNMYRNFIVGTVSLVLEFDNPFWVNASNLSDSKIGNEDNFFINNEAGLFIRERKGKKGLNRTNNNVIFGEVIK